MLLGGINNSDQYIIKIYWYFGYTIYTIFREYTNGEIFSRWLLESVTKISAYFYNIWKFQGSIKKEVEFPGVFTKNSCGNFHCTFTGPWCLILEFPRGVKQFCRISRSESLFSLEFLRVKWQIQNFHKVFIEKYHLQPPCLDFFSGIAQHSAKTTCIFSFDFGWCSIQLHCPLKTWEYGLF